MAADQRHACGQLLQGLHLATPVEWRGAPVKLKLKLYTRHITVPLEAPFVVLMKTRGRLQDGPAQGRSPRHPLKVSAATSCLLSVSDLSRLAAGCAAAAAFACDPRGVLCCSRVPSARDTCTACAAAAASAPFCRVVGRFVSESVGQPECRNELAALRRQAY